MMDSENDGSPGLRGSEYPVWRGHVILLRELNKLQPSETCFQCMHNWYLLAIFHIAIAKGDNIVAGKLVKI